MAEDEGGGPGHVAADLPPYAILEYLNVGGVRLMRVVAQADGEAEAHEVASALARAGMRVWLVDPCNMGGEARAERYPTPAMAAWAADHGHDVTGPLGVSAAQLAGL